MNEIHITLPDGTQQAYPESELQPLLSQRQIPDNAYYWQKGMEEWRPISEYTNPAAAQTDTQASTDADVPVVRSLAYDMRPLTKALVILLWIYFGMEALSLLSNVLEIQLLMREEFTEAEGALNDMRQVFIGLIFLLLYLVTAIVFLIWQFRVCKNSRSLGAKKLRYTPGWSIAYYFIPIVWLFRPYQVMKENWKVSLNPAKWTRQPGTPLLGWWWGLWLLYGVIEKVVMHMTDEDSNIQEFIISDYVSIVANVIGLVLCLLFMQLIKRISIQQRTHVNEAELTN